MPARRARRAQQDRDLEELHQTILTASHAESRTSTPASAAAESTQVVGVSDLVEALRGITGPGRSTFKAPQYGGEGDVDLFITQFTDVARANEWSAQESTLHLRSALLGKALECGRGETVEQIYEDLRLAFGMTTRQAREKLLKFQKGSKQSVREAGTEIMTLVKKAYAKLDSEDREEMALDIFTKSLESKELRRLLLVRPPSNMQEAIQLIEDFLQVGGESKHSKVTAVSEAEDRKVADAASEVATMLTQTLAALKQMMELQVATLGALKDSKEAVPRERKPVVCYECGGPHIKRNCPTLRKVSQKSGNEEGPTQSRAQLGLDQAK